MTRVPKGLPTSAKDRKEEKRQLQKAVAEHNEIEPKPLSAYYEADGWVGVSQSAWLARFHERLQLMGRRRD